MRRTQLVSLLLGLGLWLGTLIPAEAKEHWVRIDSTFFTLYAQCEMNEAREWAACFEQFRRYVNEVIRVPPTQLQPLTIVLFKNRSALMAYLPKKDGKAPTDLASQTMVLPTGTIVITSLNTVDSVTRHSFYEAGTYWFLNGFKYHGPDWFVAGLAQTFKTFSVIKDEVRLGESPKDNLKFLQSYQLMPLSELFRIDMQSLDFNGDTGTSLYFAESWALVHYLIFGRERVGNGQTRSPQLADFMEALQQGEAAEPAFKRVFGTDYDGMARRLKAYVSNGKYAIVTGTMDRAQVTADFTATAETAAGIEIILGYAALAGGENTEARRHFFAAQALPAGELRAEEALGDMASMVNDEPETQLHYTRAIELGSRSYRAYYFLGDQFMKDELRDEAHLPRFEARQARIAASRFEQAINFYPRYIPSFERLALLMPSLETFADSDRQFLELGRQVAPDNDLIAAGLGIWEIKNQQAERGRQRLAELVAAGRQPTTWVRLMARDLAETDAAGLGLTAARQLLVEGKTDEAAAQVEKLLENSTDEELRARLVDLRSEIGQLDLVMQAERLVGDKEWDAAAAIATGALEGNPPPLLRQRAETVLARAKAKQ